MKEEVETEDFSRFGRGGRGGESLADCWGSVVKVLENFEAWFLLSTEAGSANLRRISPTDGH